MKILIEKKTNSLGQMRFEIDHLNSWGSYNIINQSGTEEDFWDDLLKEIKEVFRTKEKEWETLYGKDKR